MNIMKVFPGHRTRLSALCDLIRCMNSSTFSLTSSSKQSTIKSEKRPPKMDIKN
jgi:hypothetical protein